MILLDVNVLVYAFQAAEPHHTRTHEWLAANLRSSTDRIGLAESAVSGFVRIVTSSRIYERPASSSAAVEFVDALLENARSSWLAPNDAAWRAFRTLVATDRRITSNLVPDAWLAALAIAHGARLATADRGFRRFDGLELIDPTR